MQNGGSYKCGSGREAGNSCARCRAYRTCEVPGEIGNSRRINRDRSVRCCAKIASDALKCPSSWIHVRPVKPGKIVDREKARVCAAKHTHTRIHRGSGNGPCINLLVSGDAHIISECEDPGNWARRGPCLKSWYDRGAHVS